MPRKTFSLESSLYTQECIAQAIEDFGSDFGIVSSDNILEITAVSDTEASEIFNEFMNYVLSLESTVA